MVRVFIKGGIWKNSEDEILKAAVMKYGKQQWARVASLLNRKSAKQCKARWNEWLDPSVRKVEWSREEDEKLLHLAKLFPAQWKSVGPLVGGRTAVQCQERYERLLDEASAAVGGGEGGEEDAVAGAIMARKLRPGDIDPHPETKPARPDPIDMDEDEIEMLQEARARLANTQGKKAKRKAREKMLDEAKRLADLQKRRELKQAGLLSSAMRTKSRGGKRSRREIDLGVEIPFHKPAPAGYHSTAEEDVRADKIRTKRFKNVDFQKVNEAQYKSREREAKGTQKREENRLRALERTNMQHVVAEVSRRNDPIAARKRGVLSMPEPSVTDAELEKVAKLTREQRDETAAMLASASGGASATDALLGDYTNRPLPTPMRTPMVGSGTSSQENIMREALNMRMLERGETPLLGGENPEYISGGAGSDSVLKITGASTPMIGASATPMTASGQSLSNQTPLTNSTPGPRDELGLNRPTSQKHTPGPNGTNTPLRMGGGGGDNDDVSISATSFATSVGDMTNTTTGSTIMTIKQMAIAERRAAKQARKELEMALKNLPAPQFEYELAGPSAVTDDDDDDMDGGGKAMVMAERDREELEAEEMARLKEEAVRIYEKRSSVVKRLDLPRPIGSVEEEMVLVDMEEEEVEGVEGERNARMLVREEMLTLLQHDAFHHPVLAVDEDGILDKKSDKQTKKKGKKDKKKRGGEASATKLPPLPTRPISPITEEALDMAKDMLTEEKEVIMQEKADLMMTQGQFLSEDEMKDALSNETILESMKCAEQQLHLETGWSTRQPDSTFSMDERISSIKLEIAAIEDATKATRKCADRLESKLMIKNGGYMKRAEAIEKATLQNFAELSHSKIEGEVYTMLSLHERNGMTSRIKKLEDEIEQLEKTEASSQKEYGELLHEQNRFRLLVKRL